jgi:predicted oxidoreductase
MKNQAIGSTGFTAARLAYGCMRLPGTWNVSEIDATRRARSNAALKAAFDNGYTLFDHADIYVSGVCEELFRDFLKEAPSLKAGIGSKYLIATKCGIRFPNTPPGSPKRYDFSREHIIWSCEQSLKRLGVETIDIYQLHRPDLLMDPGEVAGAFETLLAQGKVRTFGVSNFVPSFLSALQSALRFPLCVNQVEIHLGRLDCFVDGTLDQCLEKNITPLAWSPLGGGWLGTGGTVNEKDPHAAHKTKVQAAVDTMAKKHGVSRTVMCLAWLLKHPSKIMPIVGSSNPEHIKDAVKADGLELSREDWYHLLIAARGSELP